MSICREAKYTSIEAGNTENGPARLFVHWEVGREWVVKGGVINILRAGKIYTFVSVKI